MKNGFVYILTNKNNSTLYIGVTNNLLKRIYEHKTDKGSDFTIKYRLVYLVYYEEFNSIQEAISREKQLKNWHKDWKWNLIKANNPDICDLSKNWYDLDSEINSE
jgi:putative endonuclease